MSKLITVTYIDRSGNYACAPPSREAVINTDEIVSVTPIRPENTRSSYALVKVRFHDGSSLDVIGKTSDFVDAQTMDFWKNMALGLKDEMVIKGNRIEELETQLSEQAFVTSSTQSYCYNALRADGAHHKQWFLEQILQLVLRPERYERIKGEWTRGVAP